MIPGESTDNPIGENAPGDDIKPSGDNEHISKKHAQLTAADIIKALGLVAFLVLVSVCAYYLAPDFVSAFSEGGVYGIVDKVKSSGAAGVGIIFALQVIQILVAFLPGEVTQVAAGMCYGPLRGTILIVIGCVIASSIVFALVRFLGAPFVRHMVSDEWMAKFEAFEKTGKMDLIVFILFLIPALPKDLFTYIVPLTNMKYRRFIVLTTIGRIPGIFVSCFAAGNIVNGNATLGIVVIVIALAIAGLCIVFRDKLLGFLPSKE